MTTSRLCLKRKNSHDGLVGEYERIDSHRYIPAVSVEDAPSTHPVAFPGGSAAALGCGKIRRFCLDSLRQVLRTTVSVMNFVARVLL